jgi:hypothetical protein
MGLLLSAVINIFSLIEHKIITLIT